MNDSRRRPFRRPRSGAAGVVLAGGTGSRLGAGINKAFLPLSGRSIASWGLNTMATVQGIDPLVFVVRPEDREHAEFLARRETDHRIEIVSGGNTRQESELQALRHLADRIDSGRVHTVLIHDAARPLVSRGLVAAVLHAAIEHGGAVPGIPAGDLASLRSDNELAAPVWPADRLPIRVQTPQGFRASAILDAYEAAARDGFSGTDTASCAQEYSDLDVVWVRGEETNVKITYAQDLLLAQDVVAALGLRSQ